MKCFAIACFLGLIASSVCAELVENVAETSDLKAQASEQGTAASSYYPIEDKRQDKRYVGNYGAYAGYGGYGGYGGLDYNARLLDGAYGFSPYGVYGGYSGFNSNPYYNPYFNYRAGYPYNAYNRFGGLGYGTFPSSYYSSNYGNSIVGGGLGGLGIAGFVPPIGAPIGAGYPYAISGNIYK